jgi:hypothetical protein
LTFWSGRGAPPDPVARLAPRLPGSTQTPERQAWEDLFWALLNSSEFTFRH